MIGNLQAKISRTGSVLAKSAGIPLCIAGIAALTTVSAGVENGLMSGLETAVAENSTTHPSSPDRMATYDATATHAATEAEWLGYAGQSRSGAAQDAIQPVVWPGRVGKGDTITLTWRGAEREFSVISVTKLPPTLKTDGSSQARVMVSARQNGGSDSTEISFAIAAPEHEQTEIERLGATYLLKTGDDKQNGFRHPQSL